jgi:hypothetical protein
MPDCPIWVEQMYGVFGFVTPATRAGEVEAEFNRHLAACDSCRQAHQQLVDQRLIALERELIRENVENAEIHNRNRSRRRSA